MKNVKIIIGLSMIVLVSFIGCGKSAVSCDNKEAITLVISIAEEPIKDQLVHTKNPLANYKFWKSQTENTVLQNEIKEIDEMWVEAEPKIINIRLDSKDDEIQKSECSADLLFKNGNSVPIKYKLSKTSEGKLFAEVFGLK